MIKSFKHKGLQQFFTENKKKLLNKKQLPRIERLLDRLDAITSVEDMGLLGYGLHQLSGSRKGTWSVKVSGNWRITFKFVDGHVFEVNLEDYH